MGSGEIAHPGDSDPLASQLEDVASGRSDDPRVDPTPDRRHSEGPHPSATRNALGVVDPTMGDTASEQPDP